MLTMRGEYHRRCCQRVKLMGRPKMASRGLLHVAATCKRTCSLCIGAFARAHTHTHIVCVCGRAVTAERSIVNGSRQAITGER